MYLHENLHGKYIEKKKKKKNSFSQFVNLIKKISFIEIVIILDRLLRSTDTLYNFISLNN